MAESPRKRFPGTALAAALGGYALIGGFISFLGWPLDLRRLTDWFNDDVSIQPNAALLMMLSGAAVILVQRRAWRSVAAMGLLVSLGGTLILLQYIVGADFGFNHQLLFGRTWGQRTTLTPGRVGPPASASFTFIGIALLLLAQSAAQPGRAHVRVALRVADEGVGIPNEKLETIFEMFSQVDRPLERSAGGLGIGLYLVRRLVEMHGGSVEASSEGVGKGSQFIVRLPVLKDLSAVAPGAPAPVREDVNVAPVRRRILVVDDNNDAAHTMAILLKTQGHVTQTAHDGLQDIESARQFRPDIILLDIGLPKLNGYEACQQIRQQPWGKDVVMIALTGWGQEEDKRRATESGFDAHLVKPVEHAQLKELIAALLPRADRPIAAQRIES